MRRFTSFGQFSRFLAERIVEIPEAEKHGLETAARLIQEEAKAIVGHYQQSAGPFEAWAPLAPSTVAEKERLGFAPPDNPLLRTGELRDSIDHSVDENKALIGSNDPRAKWLELGTFGPRSSIPPRPFLALGAIHKAEDCAKAIGQSVFYTIVGKRIP